MSKFFKVTAYADDWNKECAVKVTTRTNLEILASSKEELEIYLDHLFSGFDRNIHYDIVETDEEFYRN